MGSWNRRARRPDRGAPHVCHPLPDASPEALADLLFGPAPDSSSDRPAPGARDSRADQLCAQVADALVLALASARDAALRDLVVAAVVPRRGAARLEVRLEVGPDVAVGEVARRVQRAAGWLRSEIADAIERKRVPELALVVVPAAPEPVTPEPAPSEEVTP
ncbi:MAG: hypothetical protein IT385_10335 [Deltaproteobacteria bacterium]|nr:hypothetical protein [Deltaproteobacteria bacterium]